MENNKERIQNSMKDLREAMRSNCVDCYIICDDDYHGSEYISDYFRAREYFSGFTGSNGKLLVTQEMSGLWTDGRYFIQAAKELDESGIELFKMGEKNVPTIEEYVTSKITPESVVALDGDVVTTKFVKSIDREIKTIDLVSAIWKDRPNQGFNMIYQVDGDPTKEKIKSIRSEMKKKKASAFLLSKLDDIAWLFNLRGSDIEHTPVFFSYALIMKDEILLFVDEKAVAGVINNKDSEFNRITSDLNIKIVPYREVGTVCNFIPASNSGLLEDPVKVMVDMEYLNYSLYDRLIKNGKEIVNSQFLTITKSVKSDREIAATRSAHIQDGVAMTEFIYAMKHGYGDFSDEMHVSDMLAEYRSATHDFVDLSFPSIVAFAENAAIAHYETSKETNKKIEGNNFLLVDSGNQYTTGTTDITRTFVVGEATVEMKKHYTLTLKSMMSLIWTKFKPGTKGSELDILPRITMWEEGIDYNHGTGHGVGHLLCVHEGPNGIGKRYADVELVPGNITAVEPGVYLEGKYGIRLENETICVTDEDDQFLILEPITFCPLEIDAINTEMLTASEIKKINRYNSLVFEEISPYLDDDQKAWLMDQTRELK